MTSIAFHFHSLLSFEKESTDKEKRRREDSRSEDKLPRLFFSSFSLHVSLPVPFTLLLYSFLFLPSVLLICSFSLPLWDLVLCFWLIFLIVFHSQARKLLQNPINPENPSARERCARPSAPVRVQILGFFGIFGFYKVSVLLPMEAPGPWASSSENPWIFWIFWIL